MPGPPSSGVQNANGQGVRVAELVAALSYAADLGLGQPLAHCMRQTVIALRLADLVGATQDEREATYYLGLMVSTYCHADAAEQARWFGDDIAFKADAFELLGKNTAQIVAFAVRRTGSHGTGVDRARRIVTLPRSGMRQVMDFLATHARLSSRFAEQIGLDDVAVASFRQAYESGTAKAYHWACAAARSRCRRGWCNSPVPSRSTPGCMGWRRRGRRSADPAAPIWIRPSPGCSANTRPTC
jgi:hypothetical protein